MQRSLNRQSMKKWRFWWTTGQWVSQYQFKRLHLTSLSCLDIVSQDWKKGDGASGWICCENFHKIWLTPSLVTVQTSPGPVSGRRSWAQCHWVGTIKYLLLGPARRGSAWAGLGIPFLSPSRVNIVRGCCRARSRNLNYSSWQCSSDTPSGMQAMFNEVRLYCMLYRFDMDIWRAWTFLTSSLVSSTIVNG